MNNEIKMATGKTGVILAVLFYSILRSMSAQNNVNHLQCVYDGSEKCFVNSSSSFTTGLAHNFSVSQDVLYKTLLSPYGGKNGFEKKSTNIGMTGKQRHKLHVRPVNTEKYIFSICLLLCGDVHPGPGQSRKYKYPCMQCSKNVKSNSKAVSCDVCEEWIHIKCGNISGKVYDNAVKSDIEIPFVCNRCTLNFLPGCDEALDTDEIGLPMDFGASGISTDGKHVHLPPNDTSRSKDIREETLFPWMHELFHHKKVCT